MRGFSSALEPAHFIRALGCERNHGTFFPVYEIEGSAYDCGRSHGEQAADRVARTLEIYLPAFARQANLGLDQVRERAREYAVAMLLAIKKAGL
ncbi:MAG: hypothetical protein ACXWCS_29440 [Burkholderiales bacterium]